MRTFKRPSSEFSIKSDVPCRLPYNSKEDEKYKELITIIFTDLFKICDGTFKNDAHEIQYQSNLIEVSIADHNLAQKKIIGLWCNFPDSIKKNRPLGTVLPRILQNVEKLNAHFDKPLVNLIATATNLPTLFSKYPMLQKNSTAEALEEIDRKKRAAEIRKVAWWVFIILQNSNHIFSKLPKEIKLIIASAARYPIDDEKNAVNIAQEYVENLPSPRS